MDHFIITIARGFGSGGKEIGSKLAKRFEIPCYESQILKMASDYSGINETLFQKADERLQKHSRSILRHLKQMPFTSIAEPSAKEFTSDINLFNIQSKIIQQLGMHQSCVIIGKCADYVLQTFPNVISIYIEAPRDNCVESIVNKLGVTEQEANKLIEKTDKFRAEYYKFYTKGGDWTNPVNYDLTINTARVGRENAVELIQDYFYMRFGEVLPREKKASDQAYD